MTLAGPVTPSDATAHRAFDFWLGHWEVHTADGKPAGVNRITREHGGRVLRERYSTARGYSGESLNIYDDARGVWHQTWVDSAGMLLVLEGGIRDGKMVLEGHTVDAGASLIRHRITWTPNGDGTVRQCWESINANDQGHTVFDGLYTRIVGVTLKHEV